MSAYRLGAYIRAVGFLGSWVVVVEKATSAVLWVEIFFSSFLSVFFFLRYVTPHLPPVIDSSALSV